MEWKRAGYLRSAKRCWDKLWLWYFMNSHLDLSPVSPLGPADPHSLGNPLIHVALLPRSWPVWPRQWAPSMSSFFWGLTDEGLWLDPREQGTEDSNVRVIILVFPSPWCCLGGAISLSGIPVFVKTNQALGHSGVNTEKVPKTLDFLSMI